MFGTLFVFLYDNEVECHVLNGSILKDSFSVIKAGFTDVSKRFIQ